MSQKLRHAIEPPRGRATVGAERGFPVSDLCDRVAATDSLALKRAFTTFMAALLPFCRIHCGLTNFLYFCDVTMIFTPVAIWAQSPLLASMPVVRLIVPQPDGRMDFLFSWRGMPLLGITTYMFGRASRCARGLSTFHAWLPFVLAFLVARLVYGRRAPRSLSIGGHRAQGGAKDRDGAKIARATPYMTPLQHNDGDTHRSPSAKRPTCCTH